MGDDALPGIARLAAGFGRLMQSEKAGRECRHGGHDAQHEHPAAGDADGALAQVLEDQRQDLHQDADDEQRQREMNQDGVQIRLNQCTCHGYSNMSGLGLSPEARLSRSVRIQDSEAAAWLGRIPRGEKGGKSPDGWG